MLQFHTSHFQKDEWQETLERRTWHRCWQAPAMYQWPSWHHKWIVPKTVYIAHTCTLDKDTEEKDEVYSWSGETILLVTKRTYLGKKKQQQQQNANIFLDSKYTLTFKQYKLKKLCQLKKHLEMQDDFGWLCIIYHWRCSTVLANLKYFMKYLQTASWLNNVWYRESIIAAPN